jgi:hypothetical protein
MSTGTVVVIVVVVIVVVALIAAAAFIARRRRLQRTFGPEYDRAVQGSDSRLKAEAELAEREKRVRHLDIRPLDPAARDGYAAQWTEIQQQFVDSPATAVTGAQTLISNVMRDEGYPTEDDDQVMADLSVEYATTLEHFRTAQDLSNRASGGTASTEDLRQAMVHYRELFRELLGSPADEPGDAAATDVPATDAPATDVAASAPAAAAADPAGNALADDAQAPGYDARSDATAAYDTPGATAGAAATPAAADESMIDPADATVSDDETVPDDETTPATAARSGRRR